MARKTYVGYDLGDGETITDLVTLETGASTSKTDFDDMTMPDTTIPGQAMPTIFAFDEMGQVIFSQSIITAPELVKNIVVNFKRRPSDLLKRNTAMSDGECIDFLKNCDEFPSSSAWEDGSSPEMQNFKNAVITFTNAIFSDGNYVNRLKSAAMDSDEIVFCVGHPTNWTDLDIAIYELILKSTILGSGMYEGKASSIIMERESRAAFLYSKDVEAFGNLPKGSSVLLIDVGSSTIDITAMTASSNNYEYNSGSNYLGARSIDFIIRDWYLGKLRQQQRDWDMYQSLVKNNPTIPGALVLACRKAKEQIYSSSVGMANIDFAVGRERLTKDELDKIIENTPIANILKETINLSDEECALMGSKSWKKLFKEFLTQKKAEMTKLDIEVGCIILTGSASRMPFVPTIVLEVFNNVTSDSLKYDMNPARTISKGLALVGPSDEEATIFQNAVNDLVDKKLENIIGSNIPSLGKKMGRVVSDIITPKMKRRIISWRNGDIKTLNDMNEKIKEDCSQENLTELLANDSRYTSAIEEWLRDTVGKDIAIELKALCDNHGVRGIDTEDLNIMTMPKISIGSIRIDPLDFMDAVSAVISIIAGVVAAASIGTIMGVIVGLLSIISESLAITLFSALWVMGPTGWGILAAVIGVAVAALASKNLDKFKDMFKTKVMGWNLPEIARKTMTDKKIDKSFAEANLPKQIEDSFNKEEVKAEIVKKVAVNLKVQIKKRAEDIKYAIRIR